MKSRCAVLLLTVVILTWWIAPATARVEWNVTGTLNLSEKPRDTAMSPSGEWIYILTDSGKILIYASNGNLEDTISVGEDVASITVGPTDDVLVLTSGKEKRVQIITLDFIRNIDVSGSPFKGPADAPVVIAVFDDFQ